MPDSNMPDLSRLKFGVGQPVPRKEDPVLLRGEGRYTDDLNLPGQALRGDRAQPRTRTA